MASPNVVTTPRPVKAFQVASLTATRGNGTRNEPGVLPPVTSSRQIQKVSLVKLAPLEKSSASNTKPLSPNTLAKLVDEQRKSHEDIEALQQRIQAATPNSFASDVRKELEQSALKQRNFLNQLLGTPVPSSSTKLSDVRPEADIQPAMLDASSDVIHSTPLAKKLFPDGSDNDVIDKGQTERSPGSDSGPENDEHNRRNSSRRNKKSDTDNDTGVDSDTGSDPEGENDGVENPVVKHQRIENPRVKNPSIDSTGSSDCAGDFSPSGKTNLSRTKFGGAPGDELLLYLEMIEQRAMAVESLIEQAKLDTVLNIRSQIEAEFNGLSLQEIPAKCHQKIDRAIQRFLERELEKIRAENRETGSEPSCKPQSVGRAGEQIGELERKNDDLREKVGSLESSVSRVDMLYLMQKKENEYLSEKITKMERQFTNERLKHESELHDVKNDYEEKTETGFSRSENARNGTEGSEAMFRDNVHGTEGSETMSSLRRRLEQEEKQNKALRVAGEADQTTIRCLEGKQTELEAELKKSRQEVGDLLKEIRELQSRAERREGKLREGEALLKEVYDERRVLRETLTMSEHEISLLENKLGQGNNEAWKDSKKEILDDLRALEKHIKVIHKEKRKLENKYLAFRIENENLSDSLSSFSKTKDILTPLGSCDVSRHQSTLSSHSSSLSSSLAGSDVEDEDTYDAGRHVSRGKISHQSGRRRKRNVQDQKDKKFAEAVARKLMFAQQVLKDQNCNFSSFENSGEDLINEADELVKRVDSLQAEKRAIKMELESIRSTQPENVQC